MRASLLSPAKAQARERGGEFGLLDAGIGEQGPIVARLLPHDLGETDRGLVDSFVANVRIDHGQERSNFFDDVGRDGLRNQIGPAPA
jgi:hypothetical protein